MQPSTTSRRVFMKQAAASSLAAAVPSLWTRRSEALPGASRRPVAPSDTLGVAAVGMGIIGFENMETVTQLPGIRFVAAADCYDARLKRTNEVYGNMVVTTRDYQELLARDDVDAVIVNTSDHWHARIAVEAMEAGKAVHIEKPMVHQIEEGWPVIRAQEATGQVAQVGSEGMSSAIYDRARELIRSGAIGVLNMVEAEVNRNSPNGAWQYTIPADASPETIDWTRFLGDAPPRAFDADRFFRWRKYWDYGTGIAGDMFVHRFTALHHVLDAVGPSEVSALGGVHYWNDGREAPDVMACIYAYRETEHHPAFVLSMKANLADGSGGRPDLTFIGSEGVLTVGGGRVRIARRGAQPEPALESIVQGYNSVRTFSEAQQQAFIDEYQAYHDETPKPRDTSDFETETTIEPPGGYSSLRIHFTRFFDAMRTGAPIRQDPTYGFRAAAPALLANHSYLEGRTFGWNPYRMEIADGGLVRTAGEE